MRVLVGAFGICVAAAVPAAEVTVKNDGLTDFSAGVIQAGFVTGEKAASWLTSPCTGNLVAVQVFWRSFTGGAPITIGDAVDIHRAGTFPTPGALAQSVLGPVLTDGVLNEYRYLDENNTIPLSVPVAQNETLVVAYTFGEDPPGGGPSVVNDADGIQPNRNAIYARIAPGTFAWFGSSALGVSGDWVIRAVVDCQAAAVQADVGVTIAAQPGAYTPGGALTYTITVANAGPSAATAVVVDTFPAAFTAPAWTCTTSGGGGCTASGSGNIADIVTLSAGGQATYIASGTVAPGTTGNLTHSAVAVVNAPATDPNQTNNTAASTVGPDNDIIFASGFDP
ncbi:MAG: DUF11 domain-containing protein [Xanthomonadales bacterium]|nr:DUF11 domain-containing protein [Xanthomonadales bacterium]